jgi:hypothetical protein
LTTITVKFTAEGFHHWPDAPEHRAYLRHQHRHLFHVEVTTPVTHHERQIEFHDLMESAKCLFRVRDVGASCETMAYQLASALSERLGKRPFTVAVFEDGECGATVDLK